MDQAFDEANLAHERGAERLQEVKESIGPTLEKKKQVKDRFDHNKNELVQLLVSSQLPLRLSPLYSYI